MYKINLLACASVYRATQSCFEAVITVHTTIDGAIETTLVCLPQPFPPLLHTPLIIANPTLIIGEEIIMGPALQSAYLFAELATNWTCCHLSISPVTYYKGSAQYLSHVQQTVPSKRKQQQDKFVPPSAGILLIGHYLFA